MIGLSGRFGSEMMMPLLLAAMARSLRRRSSSALLRSVTSTEMPQTA